MQPVIRVENLSKRYRIDHTVAGTNNYRTLRDSIGSVIKASFKSWKFNGKGSSVKEDFWALKDVSFEVQPGEVVGIIGRNGAGKSTLLKILSRITKPTGGHISLHGRVGSLLEVGTGFHPELTGRENVYLNGSILGMSRREIDRQFDTIVDFSGVEKFLDTPVKRYSSGMYVRLAFAVAAHLDPEILIVDEVLAVGDAAFQKKCLGKLKDVSGAGRTILFVSHNMGMLRTLCKTAILFKNGRIIDNGPSHAVIDAYSASEVDISKQQIDLATLKRSPGLGEQLRVLEIHVNQGQLVHHGDPLEIKLTYEAFEPISQAAFGFGIGTLEGTRLVTLDSDQTGPSHDIHQGIDSVTVVVDDIWLEPGVYSITVCVRTGQLSWLDFLANCGYVEVLPSEHSTAAAYASYGGGGVRPPMNWTTPRNVVGAAPVCSEAD